MMRQEVIEIDDRLNLVFGGGIVRAGDTNQRCRGG